MAYVVMLHMAECGTDGHRFSARTTWQPLRAAPIDRADPTARRAEIVARRRAGETWPAVALAVGLSRSRVRRLYAEAAHPAPRHTPDDTALLDNLAAFVAATGATSRRAYTAWPGRITSPATLENHFGSWARAVTLAADYHEAGVAV